MIFLVNSTKRLFMNKYLILLTVIFMDFLAGMEFDLFVPSFPELQNHFHLTPFWVEALLSSNFIGYCLSLFIVGDLADRIGRKPMILLGLILFTIGSVLCLWGISYPFLIIGRFLQGLGVAAPAMLSFLIISDSYPVKDQQFLLSMLNGSMNIAAAAAPVMGSYITQYCHWQGNFTTLLLIGVVVLLMTLFFIPSYKLSEHKEPFSLQGYKNIFQSKSLVLLTLFFVATFVPFWVFVGMSPLLFMKSLGVSLTNFGFYQGSFSLVYALGSILFGFCVNRCDQRKMLIISNAFSIISLITIFWVAFLNGASALLITLAFLPFVISQIAPGNILYPICLELMPNAKARITAIQQGGRLILASVCLQIAGHFYQGTFTNIGIMLCSFILLGVIFLFYIIHLNILKPLQ